MTFRLVRTAGIELVDAVNAAVASMGSDDSRSSTEKAMGAVDAYIRAASEPPTDAEIDELCRKMWGGWWYWEHDCDSDPPHRASQQSRDEHRRQMRVFLAALEGKQP